MDSCPDVEPGCGLGGGASFDAATTGAGAALWMGEAGILTALVLVVAADIFSRGTWAYVRRLPESGVPLSQRLAQKPARVT